jgi:hypothetical protein
MKSLTEAADNVLAAVKAAAKKPIVKKTCFMSLFPFASNMAPGCTNRTAVSKTPPHGLFLDMAQQMA